jgi:hypothetical protein
LDFETCVCGEPLDRADRQLEGFIHYHSGLLVSRWSQRCSAFSARSYFFFALRPFNHDVGRIFGDLPRQEKMSSRRKTVVETVPTPQQAVQPTVLRSPPGSGDLGSCASQLCGQLCGHLDSTTPYARACCTASSCRFSDISRKSRPVWFSELSAISAIVFYLTNFWIQYLGKHVPVNGILFTLKIKCQKDALN